MSPPDRCRQCGGPKPPGQGRKYCSPECAALGPAAMRECPECGVPKLVGKEIREKAEKCEACHTIARRAYARAHYEANRERVLAKVKAYREANAEKIRARARAHYEENREAVRAKQAAYYQANKAAQKERAHRWYEANRDKHKEATARYRRAHLDRVRRNNRTWYQRIMADPVTRARRLEDQRMAERLRAERAGRPMKPVSEVVYFQRYGKGQGKGQERVSAEPVRELIMAHVDDIAAFAEGAGLSESFVSRVVHRHTTVITVRDADLLCAALKLPMKLVYADEAA